jgi:hypothetical protein
MEPQICFLPEQPAPKLIAASIPRPLAMPPAAMTGICICSLPLNQSEGCGFIRYVLRPQTFGNYGINASSLGFQCKNSTAYYMNYCSFFL